MILIITIIRIQYPSDRGKLDLSFLENNSADIDFYPLEDLSQAIAVKVQVKTLTLGNMTLDDYTKTQINYTEDRLLEANTTTLAGLPANKIIFTILGLKTMQVWTIKTTKYTILHIQQRKKTSKTTYIAERMIKSFQTTD